MKRYNKAIWELRKILTFFAKSQSYILMNIGTFIDEFLEASYSRNNGKKTLRRLGCSKRLYR
jgi:hypothetical protein